MDKNHLYGREYMPSPIDNHQWIEQALFDYLKKTSLFSEQGMHQIKTSYNEFFKAFLSRVHHLIRNDLDRGNVYFALTAASIYDSLLKENMSRKDAFLLTDNSLNTPIRQYITQGSKKFFDNARDPFDALVQSSKEREKNYFGESFLFERPVDDTYGYILNIKKCLFHETLKAIGKTELQAILCHMDLAWINAIDPEKHLMQFVRPVTFSTGNICQMWFIRKEADKAGH